MIKDTLLFELRCPVLQVIINVGSSLLLHRGDIQEIIIATDAGRKGELVPDG